MESSSKRVLVTGITGFLGCQIAHDLLEKNYLVKGTVRNLNNTQKLQSVKSLPNQQNLELVEADLLNPSSWDKAVENCTYVLHVASPFPTKNPKDENELIKPAVTGTVSVLNACAAHPEVKHVVVTSSIASIMSMGKFAKDHYDENDWPVMDNLIAYNKSKTLAEKEAWKIYESLDKEKRFKLTTINPGYIFGPSLVNTNFSSGDIIKQILTGDLITIPKLYMPIVDVRDVSTAHIMAMESDKADGQRYICLKDHIWMSELAEILEKNFGKYGYKVTKRCLPYFIVGIATLFDAQAKSAIGMWNKKGEFSNEKIKKDFGIEFRSAEEAVLEMANSLIKMGIVPDYINKENQTNCTC